MWPERYFSGLKSRALRLIRAKELTSRKSKLGFSNAFAKKRKSRWTTLFHKTYPGLKFDKNAISKRTGIPVKTLDTVYDRGLKAWRTSGSRPGATSHQWAIARVYKFVLITKKKAKTNRPDPDSNLRKR
jgi:hypothetical protein